LCGAEKKCRECGLESYASHASWKRRVEPEEHSKNNCREMGWLYISMPGVFSKKPKLVALIFSLQERLLIALLVQTAQLAGTLLTWR